MSGKLSNKELLEYYQVGGNIIQKLKESGSEFDLMKAIEVAYDLQAGSYVKAFRNPEHAKNKRTKCAEMASIVSKYIETPNSLLKVGVGEAVTLVPFLEAFPNPIGHVHGFDISWSRIHHAQGFLNEHQYPNVKLCTGTLQQIPFKDNSFDVIMSSHALEPNGGFEEMILKELYRVSSNIVALFEPSYEFASESGRVRMDNHGYIKEIIGHAEQIGFKVLEHRPLKTAMNPLNPTAAYILQVPDPVKALPEPQYACPVTKSSLCPKSDGYFSEESFYYYPILNEVPLLRETNAILASAIRD
jgi:hypothetical protein